MDTNNIPAVSIGNIVQNMSMIPAKVPTLCLNMIVKNENRIILRLLESVVKIVDSYCICDTGSTDNTIDLITSFFGAHNIPGKIVKEPFRDFGYNRTFALDSAVGMPNADYLLLLDADMIFWLNPEIPPVNFKLDLLLGDAFFIYQGSDGFYYKNVRIVKNNYGVKYWGVTHEYTELPEGARLQQILKPNAFIYDIGDGGAKGDKYERDIRLLQRGLLENPNNERYLFYLANSYNNGGYQDDAIKMYKKRIEIGGWIEEIWNCYFNIGKIYREHKKDIANAIWWWLEGYRKYPNRIEQIYDIVKYYRETGAHDIAYIYYELAHRARNKYPNWDYLFMRKDIYDYLLDYEFSIIGYYCNPHNEDMTKVSMKVLADPKIDEVMSKNTMSNYKFYAKKLADSDVFSDKDYVGSEWAKFSTVLNLVGTEIYSQWSDRASFFKSTPSIVSLNSNEKKPSGTFVVCQRYVNYYIDEKGGYVQNGNIITRNVIGIIENGSLVREFELKYDTDVDNVYIGLEDVRLWTESISEDFEVPRIYYSCNRGIGYSNMVVEVGEIDLLNKCTVNSRQLRMGNIETVNPIEKNWIITGAISLKTELLQSLAVVPNDSLEMIYGWYPVVTGGLAENIFVRQNHQPILPKFFQFLRGSTNTIEVDGDLWCICHAVSYEERRYYYHIVVVLDKATRMVKKYTPFFTFSGEKVEYTLGMALTGDRLIIGYSVLDKESRWMAIPKYVVKDMLISL